MKKLICFIIVTGIIVFLQWGYVFPAVEDTAYRRVDFKSISTLGELLKKIKTNPTYTLVNNTGPKGQNETKFDTHSTVLNTSAVPANKTTVIKPTITTKKKENVQKEKPQDNCPKSKTIKPPPANKEVTIVTAYFNLGTFQKGSGSVKFSESTYRNWMKTFRFLNNPLVVYVDSEDIAHLFREQRKTKSNVTKIFVIQRNQTWAFGQREKIKKIFSTPGYPKHPPNTVYPDYSCAQHAKYDVLEKAINANYFSTEYFSWLDIGYFRNIVSCHRDFKLVLPDKFNETKVSFTQVSNRNMDTPIRNIFYQNLVWVGGGMVLAKKETMVKFIALYRLATEKFIDMSLASTDQQVIYSLYSTEGRKLLNVTVELQPYRSDNWFHLGFLCHRYVENFKNSSSSP